MHFRAKNVLSGTKGPSIAGAEASERLAPVVLHLETRKKVAFLCWITFKSCIETVMSSQPLPVHGRGMGYDGGDAIDKQKIRPRLSSTA